jgi:hypothetical protein
MSQTLCGQMEESATLDTVICEQVQRNIERFPEDFMFQLTDAEVDFMVSQNAIPSRKHLEKKWFAFSMFETGAVEMLTNLEVLGHGE